MNPNLGTTSKSREWWYVNIHLRIFRFATTYNTRPVDSVLQSVMVDSPDEEGWPVEGDLHCTWSSYYCVAFLCLFLLVMNI